MIPAISLMVALAAAPVTAQEVEQLSKQQGGDAVLRAIQAMGGWEAWKARKTIQYERLMTRFEKNGQIVHEKQFHSLTLPPEVKIRQETIREGKKIATGFNGTEAWVTEAGQRITEPARLTGARNSSFGTQYMLCLPFKLAGDGSRLQSLGVKKVGANEYDVVRVTYPPGSGDNSDHVWTLHFNRKNRLMERLDWSNAAGTSHSISEYDDFRKIDGLLWPTRRTNYERAPDGGRGRKLTELVYRNIRFNLPVNATPQEK